LGLLKSVENKNASPMERPSDTTKILSLYSIISTDALGVHLGISK